MSVVLGIDPGLASNGYGILTSSGRQIQHVVDGVINTVSTDSHAVRLLSLSNQLGQIIDRYQPDEAAIEKLFFSKNVRSALPVAEARGVIILVLAQRGVNFSEYSPGVIKKAVAGHSRATKMEMVRSVKLVIGLKDRPVNDHSADALAIALCHVQHAPVRHAIAMSTLRK